MQVTLKLPVCLVATISNSSQPSGNLTQHGPAILPVLKCVTPGSVLFPRAAPLPRRPPARLSLLTFSACSPSLVYLFLQDWVASDSGSLAVPSSLGTGTELWRVNVISYLTEHTTLGWLMPASLPLSPPDTTPVYLCHLILLPQ